MSATLLAAITATVQGDATVSAALPQSPWLDEPPEGRDFPYLVVTGVLEDEDVLNFEQEKGITSHWDFVLYQKGEAATEALALAVLALFDGVTATDTPPTLFAISRRNLIRSTLVRYRVRLEGTRSADARRITEACMSFTAEWQYA